MVKVELLMAPGWGWRMLRPRSSVFVELRSRSDCMVRTLDVPEGTLLVNYQVEGIQPPRFCFYFLVTKDGPRGVTHDQFRRALLEQIFVQNSARVIGVTDRTAGFSVRVRGLGRLEFWLPKGELPDELAMKVAEFNRMWAVRREAEDRRRALMRSAAQRSEELLKAFLERFPEVKEVRLGAGRGLAFRDFIVTSTATYYRGKEICVNVGGPANILTSVDRMIAKAIAMIKMPERIMAEAARYQEAPREGATATVGDIALETEVDLVNMEFIVTLNREHAPNAHMVASVIERAAGSSVIVEGNRLRVLPWTPTPYHLRRVAAMVMRVSLDYSY